MNTVTATTTHKFEAAGLGLAPYTFTGIEVMVGPIRRPDGSEVGAPGQPMGTCQYCGHGIKDAYYLRSADGREFYVGSDCIRKAGDKGLVKVVSDRERVKRQLAAKKRKLKVRAAEQLVTNELKALLADQVVRDTLASQPHPCIPNLTRLDYAEFILNRAGATGRAVLLNDLRSVVFVGV